MCVLDPENHWGLLLNRGITAAFLDGRITSAPPLRLRREGLTASRSWPTRACLVYHIRDLFGTHTNGLRGRTRGVRP